MMTPPLSTEEDSAKCDNVNFDYIPVPMMILEGYVYNITGGL